MVVLADSTYMSETVVEGDIMIDSKDDLNVADIEWGG